MPARKRDVGPAILCLLFISGIVLLITLGAIEWNKYSIIREENCITVDFEDRGNSLVFTGFFELRDGSQKNWTMILRCSGKECDDFINKYDIGLEYVCYWYPNIDVVSIYDDLATPGMIMVFCGIGIPVAICCLVIISLESKEGWSGY